MSTTYQHKPGTGSLFRREKKSEKHPNLGGQIMLPNGELRWISAWSNKTAAGEPWISLIIGDVVQGSGQPMTQHSQAKGNGFQPQADDSDIPF